MICWHRWSKWEQYEQEYGYRPPIPEEIVDVFKQNPAKFDLHKKRIRERRHCEKCNRLQDHVVTELLS
jgi:hypothetical protein